jgi:hypothetical protein
MATRYKLKNGVVLAEAMARNESFSAIQSKVYNAINTNIRKGIDMDLDNDGDADMGDYAYVVDLYPTCAIYSMNGMLFSIDYTVDGDIVSLGTPVEVEVCYAPVTESSRAPFRLGEPFKEGAYDRSTGKLTVKVIQPGFNTSKSRFYKESTLKRDYKIFEGAKMFANHQTAVEEKARPEGDINQWVANLTRTWVESDGTVMGEAVVIDPTFKQKLENLSEAKLLHEMGISIRAFGEAYEGTIDSHKTVVVESFLAARSVDFVTYPGAGGRVEAIESDTRDPNDLGLVTLSELRKGRPDLVLLIESNAKREYVMAEKTLAQLQAELTESERKRTEAETKLTEAQGKEKKAVAAAHLTKLLSEGNVGAKLPTKSKERLQKRFAETTDITGMEEAVKDEVTYVAEITGKPVVKDMGEGAQPGTVQAGAVNLEESFKLLPGMTPELAKIAAAGRK